MEGREIIFPGYNVSVEYDSIKELLIARPDVIFIVIRILKYCQIKQRNILVIKKTKAFKYGRQLLMLSSCITKVNNPKMIQHQCGKFPRVGEEILELVHE